MFVVASIRAPAVLCGANPLRTISVHRNLSPGALVSKRRSATPCIVHDRGTGIVASAVGAVGAVGAAGVPSAGDPAKAGLSSAIRNIGWISFWSQFVLSVVSGVVLLFSTGVTSGAAQVSPTDALTATGVLTGLIAAFISWGLVRTGRLIAEGKQVKLEFVMAAVLASTRLNLIGLGATILGMQASIGGLVAKTLSSAAGGIAYYNVFTVQSGMNSILAHYVGLVLAYWLLSILRRHIAKEESA